jgi:hypothetical protein
LYLSLQESLVSRAGSLGFFHDYLRQAVYTRYLNQPEQEFEAHRRLSDYYECMFSDLGEQRGYRALSLRSAEAALDVALRSGNRRMEAEGRLLVAGASISQAVGISSENARHFERAWEMARKAGELAQAEKAWDLLADSLTIRACTWTRSNPDLGRYDLIDRALELRKRRRDPEGRRDAFFSRAIVALGLRRLDEIEEPLRQAQRIQRRLRNGDPLKAGHIQQVWGEYYAMRGWWPKAERALREARRMYRARRYSGGVCAAEGWLGLTLCHQGSMKEGLRLVRKALRFERDGLGSAEGAAKWLHGLGELFLSRGETGRALDAFGLCEPLLEEQNHAHLEETRAKLTEPYSCIKIVDYE